MARDEHRRSALAVVAPGTALRDGLERIVRGNTGALIVLGIDPVVEQICSGGFELDTEFSATRLRELAKMDGAIVLDQACGRIVRAAVQLVPDPRLPTQESGTRHRTAERAARQTGFLVITVSKSMRTIAVFTGGERYVLEDSAALLARAHQALGTLERYRRRLDDAAAALTALEIEDRATVADVALLAQRLEMADRVTDEIAGYLVELGTDGRLLGPQLEELTAGIRREREFLFRDYPPGARGGPDLPDGSITRTAHVTAMGGTIETGAPGDRGLSELGADELLDLPAVAAAIGLGGADDPDQQISGLGYRLLGQVPRLPEPVVDSLVAEFGGLQKLLSATAHDLQRAGGLDPVQARAVREALSRIAESALLEQYS
ncbi:MAG TPA: DNA integrity scanning diadenylate cyclase DisA [Streptosporangiaceae bacterium]|nr:DNA integrity scanning diadenylate cyclase DisA [Streptosporangiaceae bacterium]